ncbi:MAG: hypothetical protein ACD_65C00119G0001, partial [uncultured bacterium]
MLSGFVCVLLSISLILADRTCVLPVPGPATTRTGPSISETAVSWAGLSVIRKLLKIGF